MVVGQGALVSLKCIGRHFRMYSEDSMSQNTSNPQMYLTIIGESNAETLLKTETEILLTE